MVPVPFALETVLKESAKLLWFQQKNSIDGTDRSCTTSNLIGRISAVDIKAPAPGYPNHNSSIMDGYAIRTNDLTSVRDEYESLNESDKHDFVVQFVIVGRAYAGDGKVISSPEHGHITSIYVTTGAVIPEGYDAVIPVEETRLLDVSDGHEMIQISSTKVQSVLHTKPWTWVRTIGCDISPGSIVLSKGEVIQPVHLALLSQIGMSLRRVKVKELVRVGLLSTGNELLANGTAIEVSDGKIPDVNRPLLLAQLSAYRNCEALDLGIVSDDESIDTISTKLNDALWSHGSDCADVIITTGGISMGEKDIMEHVFVNGMGGKVHFGR